MSHKLVRESAKIRCGRSTKQYIEAKVKILAVTLDI